MTHEGDEEEKDRGFVVIDRRSVDDEEESADDSRETRRDEDPEAAAPPAQPQFGAEPATGEAKIAEIDFSTLVHSFAISALYHMGAAPPAPEAPEAPQEINLPVARQNIDILEVLEEKTRGNLSDEEHRLLEGVLYEVRMRFVEAAKRA